MHLPCELSKTGVTSGYLPPCVGSYAQLGESVVDAVLLQTEDIDG